MKVRWSCVPFFVRRTLLRLGVVKNPTAHRSSSRPPPTALFTSHRAIPSSGDLPLGISPPGVGQRAGRLGSNPLRPVCARPQAVRVHGGGAGLRVGHDELTRPRGGVPVPLAAYVHARVRLDVQVLPASVAVDDDGSPFGVVEAPGEAGVVAARRSVALSARVGGGGRSRRGRARGRAPNSVAPRSASRRGRRGDTGSRGAEAGRVRCARVAIVRGGEPGLATRGRRRRPRGPARARGRDAGTPAKHPAEVMGATVEVCVRVGCVRRIFRGSIAPTCSPRPGCQFGCGDGANRIAAGRGRRRAGRGRRRGRGRSGSSARPRPGDPGPAPAAPRTTPPRKEGEPKEEGASPRRRRRRAVGGAGDDDGEEPAGDDDGGAGDAEDGPLEPDADAPNADESEWDTLRGSDCSRAARRRRPRVLVDALVDELVESAAPTGRTSTSGRTGRTISTMHPPRAPTRAARRVVPATTALPTTIDGGAEALSVRRRAAATRAGRALAAHLSRAKTRYSTGRTSAAATPRWTTRTTGSAGRIGYTALAG